MGLPEKLASWETYMQVKKQQLELDMKQWTGSKLGMEFIKALCWHPAYLTFIQDTLCEMPGWMKHTLISRLLREILNQIHRWCYPYGRKWRGIKKSLGEGERGSEKFGLKLNIQKWRSWHLVASLHGKSWQVAGETMVTVIDFIFWAPKSLWTVIEATKLKDTCSLEEKKWWTYLYCSWLLSHVWLFETVAYQAPLSMGILQARTLEWVAMPTSRGSSNPGIEPRSLALKADFCSIPRSGRFPWRRECCPLQNSCLENSMERGAWFYTVWQN